MLTRRFAFAIVPLLGLSALASAAGQEWFRSVNVNVPSTENGYSIRTDAAGNIFTLSLRGNKAAFWYFGQVVLRKYNSSGVQLLEVPVAGRSGGTLGPGDFRVDSAGNVYTLATEYDAVNFTPGAVLTKYSGANLTQLWKYSLGANFLDSFTGRARLAIDLANNPVVASSQQSLNSQSRFRVVKLNGSTGAVLWSRLYTRNAPTRWDSATDLALDASNNVIVGGTTSTDPTCSQQQQVWAFAQKFRASDGAPLWATPYTSATNIQGNSVRVARDSASVPYLATLTKANNGFGQATVVKLNASTGAATWTKNVSDAGFNGITLSLSGFLIGTNNEAVVSADAFGMSSGAVVARFTTAGVQKWFRFVENLTYSSGFGFLFFFDSQRLVALADDGICVTGSKPGAEVNGRVSANLSTVKLNGTTGVQVWRRDFATSATNTYGASAIIKAPSGNPLVVGGVDNGTESQPNQTSVILAMNPGTGAALWNVAEAQDAIGGFDTGASVALNGSGGTYATGSRGGQIVTYNYNATGTLVWSATYDGVAGDGLRGVFEGGSKVLVDAQNNAIVIGRNRGKLVVLKYSPTGTRLWFRRLDSISETAASVDKQNNVHVGYEVNGNEVVGKLNGATGATLWTRIYKGPYSSNDIAAIVTDGSNNTIVTGVSSDDSGACPNETNARVHTMKLNTANGAILWQRTTQPPAVGDAHPIAVFVDSANNPIVVGDMQATATQTDYFALKLNAGTGAQTTLTRYDTATMQQYATAAVKDAAGNIFLTGIVPRSAAGTTGDSFTVKINGSTLARIFGVVAPVGNDFNFATSVAVNSDAFYLGGYSLSQGAPKFFASKLNASTGAVQQTFSFGTPTGFFGHLAAVASPAANKLVLVGTVAGSNATNADFYITKYGF
ncbi:MAG: hypothetical protein KIT11_00880 [Fimbriimonadaceae bacterium]|nr:hypothetical protein [Fimbriimonadaceae bacterium]QYK55072.1 MAG: hypothetical protein KF733_08655 [Fimbriimonadaceae bacterium]